MTNHTLHIYKTRGCATFLPYHLPAGRPGKFEVTREAYKKGRTVTTVSIRNAIFMGLPPSDMVLDRDVIVHHLYEDDYGHWMSTQPQELEQHERQLARAHGRVLVGGLGLGLAPAILQRNPRVTSIVVVEKSHNVAKLVWPHLPKDKLWLVRRDLFAYLRDLQKADELRFDFAFYDIWCPTGQHEWHRTVKPLRHLSVGVVPQSELECWNEEEMLGQVRMSLMNRILIESMPSNEGLGKFKQGNVTDKQFNDPSHRQGNADTWPFLNWMRHEKPTVVMMHAELENYMECLKDAVAWKERWARYERIQH